MFKQIQAAKERLKGYANVTPIMASRTLNRLVGAEVYFKCENFQRIGAFKFRGAFNSISQLTKAEKAKGVITASAGNHAQGVALAANRLGLKALIIMPKTTPGIKVSSVMRLEAEIELVGNTYDDAYAHAKKLAETTGMTYVHPYDDPDVIAGQGTIAKEIIEQAHWHQYQE